MANETTPLGKNGYSANIFRQEALDALNIIDEPVTELTIVSTPAWLWLLTCLILVSGVMIWSLYGEITMSIECPGIILTSHQINEAEMSMTNNLKEKADQLAELEDLYQKKLTLYKKHYLTRADIFQANEAFLSAKHELEEHKKDLLITMKQSKINSPLVAVAFSTDARTTRVTPGMRGEATLTVNKHQTISGQVATVSNYPISKQLANIYLRNDTMTESYFNSGVPFFIKMTVDSATWQPGTKVAVKINYASCIPLHYLTHRANCE